MRRGFKGYKSGCCDNFGIWGTSCNAPEVNDMNEHGGADNAPRQVGVPYDIGSWQNIYDVTVHKNVVPELWPNSPNRGWSLTAAKVPTSYPGVGCNPKPSISSASDGGDGSWSVDLCSVNQHDVTTEDDVTTNDMRKGWVFALSSRVIYVDGQQKYVSYRSNGRFPNGVAFLNPGGPSTPSQISIGDHHIVDIDSQSLIATYNVATLKGQLWLFLAADPTVMESSFGAFRTQNTLNLSLANVENFQPPANSFQCGKEYFLISSYYPGIEDIDTGWQVARVKYNGYRVTGDGLEVFSSLNDGSPLDVGLSGTSYAGEYVIVLPSCRTYIDSSVATTGTPDEAWVCAKTVTGPTKLVTGRWQERVYRPGIGSEDESTGVADGTLSDDEIENIIVDAEDSPIEGETWENLQVRCYNRVYDPITRHSKDLFLFTTDNPVPITFHPLADFEPDSPSGIGYLDHGFSGFLSFNSYGTVAGNNWMSDTTNAYTGDEGGWSAITNNNVAFEGTSDLSITVNVISADSITFKYRLDNREHATRGDIFSSVVNFPNPNNNLQFWLDGILIHTVDMVNYPLDATGDPDKFDAWYDETIMLDPGTHTIRWTLSRVDANDVLIAQLDVVQFPELLLGNDVNGYKRWYYDGSDVREANFWAWAKRDEEDTITISSRSVTIPDFITMDGQGRILYGNPHYVVRITGDGLIDRSFGGPRGDNFGEPLGYVRFTASPNIGTSETVPPCWDPDGRVLNTDSISDPPWGAFQILPVGDNFQVRGANASIRDASIYPIDKDLFTYKHPINGQTIPEEFREYLNVIASNLWSMRANGWTISDDGSWLLPHVEVIWRPTLMQPAWPEPSGSWIDPPYRSDFANSTTTGDWAPASTRPRNPLFLPESSDKPRWALINWIIPRTYSDAWSRDPQCVWVRNTDDPPSDPDDENWWDPDWPPGFSNAAGPWGSAKWNLELARFNPNGFRQIHYTRPTSLENVCSARDLDNESPMLTGSAVWRIELGIVAFYGFTDFDAVNCDCDCCQ